MIQNVYVTFQSEALSYVNRALKGFRISYPKPLKKFIHTLVWGSPPWPPDYKTFYRKKRTTQVSYCSKPFLFSVLFANNN